LIKDAWKGKGLGNQFLSVAAQSDALLHVVDVSGGIDTSGQIAEAGYGDPISDFADIEEELIMWYHKILEGNRDKLSKLIQSGTDFIDAITDLYRGIGVTKSHVHDSSASVGCLSDLHAAPCFCLHRERQRGQSRRKSLFVVWWLVSRVC